MALLRAHGSIAAGAHRVCIVSAYITVVVIVRIIRAAIAMWLVIIGMAVLVVGFDKWTNGRTHNIACTNHGRTRYAAYDVAQNIHSWVVALGTHAHASAGTPFGMFTGINQRGRIELYLRVVAIHASAHRVRVPSMRTSRI